MVINDNIYGYCRDRTSVSVLLQNVSMYDKLTIKKGQLDEEKSSCDSG